MGRRPVALSLSILPLVLSPLVWVCAVNLETPSIFTFSKRDSSVISLLPSTCDNKHASPACKSCSGISNPGGTVGSRFAGSLFLQTK